MLDTIEMDLMQAQIGELTAELTGAQERLKKLEEGGAGGGGGGDGEIIICNVTGTPSNPVADIAFSELRTAIEQGKTVLFRVTATDIPSNIPILIPARIGESGVTPIVYGDILNSPYVDERNNLLMLSVYRVQYSSDEITINEQYCNLSLQ